jgi:methylmalonyl-CoA mutase N-terminal domain/subunit
MDMDEESKKRTKDAKERWEKSVLEDSLRNLQEGKESYESLSGIPVDRIYTPLDIERDDSISDIGFPGEFPYTRGVYPTMYRSRLWTMRQYAGFGTAEDTNKRYKYLLEQGQTGLSVAFDLPTQMGYDSDNPMATGEVGKVGVAISSLRDMEVLFEGIPLDKVSTSMTINSTAMILLAMYVAVGEKQGVDRSNLRGTIQNDILKEYVARGTYIFAPEPSMRLVTDTIEFCSKEMKRWNSISISGYHIREAGSTAIQEIAFTLANAIAYVDAVVSRKLYVDAFAPRLTFFFCAHNDLLEEVAKFRAARRLWARIMKDRFGAKMDRSMMLRFHTQTSGVSLTAQQPENNAIRVAIQATLALRTQQIIAHESGVTNTIDPLAGSYFLESLTDEIETKTMEYIQKIDEMGGVEVAIEKGYLQQEIADSAEPGTMDTLKVNPEVESRQVQGLMKLKDERDNGKVSQSLKDLKEEAGKDTNLVPYVLDCVSNLATLGEISDVLREVFGRYEGGRTV